jgi:hypothetical protein
MSAGVDVPFGACGGHHRPPLVHTSKKAQGSEFRFHRVKAMRTLQRDRQRLQLANPS